MEVESGDQGSRHTVVYRPQIRSTRRHERTPSGSPDSYVVLESGSNFWYVGLLRSSGEPTGRSLSFLLSRRRCGDEGFLTPVLISKTLLTDLLGVFSAETWVLKGVVDTPVAPSTPLCGVGTVLTRRRHPHPLRTTPDSFPSPVSYPPSPRTTGVPCEQ